MYSNSTISSSDAWNDSITLTPFNPSIPPFTFTFPYSDAPQMKEDPCSKTAKLLDPSKKSIPEIKNIIFNNPATIVFWEDNTKTVVKCMSGYEYDEYAGFMAAVCKKLFGSSSAVQKIVKQYMNEENMTHD